MRHASPQAVSLERGAIALSVGLDHVCATTDDGSVYCWGDNNAGELGDGTSTARLSPKRIETLSDPISLVAGSQATCAVTKSDVLCWGWIGDQRHSSPFPVAGISASDVRSLGVGENYACALTTSGGVKCWGAGYYLGNGSTTPSATPVDVTDLTSDVVALGTSGTHACAAKTGGEVLCWGSNSLGQLGTRPPYTSTPTPTLADGVTDPIVAISAGFQFTCGKTSTGDVECWGDATQDQYPAPVDWYGGRATTVSGFSANILSLSCGSRHSCATLDDGSVACWGYNALGALGDGTTVSSATPVLVKGL